ncbi:MAG: hypothetical protein K6G15_03505 [Desulfovibrio sp.]|nr:hypothetical protein [Desulfovibrio sp.]
MLLTAEKKRTKKARRETQEPSSGLSEESGNAQSMQGTRRMLSVKNGEQVPGRIKKTGKSVVNTNSLGKENAKENAKESGGKNQEKRGLKTFQRKRRTGRILKKVCRVLSGAITKMPGDILKKRLTMAQMLPCLILV